MENQYCLFHKNEKILFGWIKETRKNKLVVLPEQGKEFTCSGNRLEYVWESAAHKTDTDALGYLEEKSHWSRQKSEEIEIELIHELCEANKGHTVDELSEDFLDDPSDLWLHAAFFLSLKANDKYFQYKKGLFYPRSADEIERFELNELKKKEAIERQKIESRWAEQLGNNEKIDISDDETDHWRQFLNRMVHFLTYWERSSEKDYFASLFHFSMYDQEKSERKLLDYLAQTERHLSWGELTVRRALIETEYSQPELEAVAEILKRDVWQTPFLVETRDLRESVTYTVDNEETSDFDDAISWSGTDHDTTLVQIHIADVASYLASTSPIFEMASKRMSTLYTIKTIYPMLHPDLSENLFSLVAGEERPVMTFEAEIDAHGQIIESKIFRSIIRVDRNLSYNFVDDIIDDDSHWSLLWATSQNIRDVRIANGSLELDRVEVKIDIADPSDIKVKEARMNTPASLIIQELAILTNHIAASFCVDNEISALYRIQPPYTVLREPGEGEKLTIKDINIQPARISLQADAHSALGLDCYMQVTSPIRRFLDLVNQSIIFSSLGEQQPPFQQEDLLIWAKIGEETQREYNQVERKLLDHWKFKYLDQHKDLPFDIQVNRQFRNGKFQVNFVLLQLMADVRLEGLSPGMDLTVKIDSLDLVTKRLQLTVVSMPDDHLETVTAD